MPVITICRSQTWYAVLLSAPCHSPTLMMSELLGESLIHMATVTDKSPSINERLLQIAYAPTAVHQMESNDAGV